MSWLLLMLNAGCPACFFFASFFLYLLGHPSFPFSAISVSCLTKECRAKSQCGAFGAREWCFYPFTNFSNPTQVGQTFEKKKSILGCMYTGQKKLALDGRMECFVVARFPSV
ncbi:hypothetical protein FB451DRAFT_1226755 [Mycena latifolia]|nr:hypothetical protein FB451DRAFT_1226755 [Mycena latifolia]